MAQRIDTPAESLTKALMTIIGWFFAAGILLILGLLIFAGIKWAWSLI